MSVRRRMSRMGDRLFDAMRHRSAFTVTDDAAVEGDLGPLRGHKYALLVTFRANGDAVPSPVWAGVDDAGRAYVRSVVEAGKVKRLRRDGRAVLAPCTSRGKPVGPAVKVTGRVLPEQEWPHAEATLAAAYGAGRKVFERLMGEEQDSGTYLEFAPRS